MAAQKRSALRPLAVEPHISLVDWCGRTAEHASPDRPYGGIEHWEPARACRTFEDVRKRFRYRELDNKGFHRTHFTIQLIAWEEILAKLKSYEGKAEKQVIRAFGWPTDDGRGAAVFLVGTEDNSKISQDLVSQLVFEAGPSALALQLCPERIGWNIAVPKEHRYTAADWRAEWLSKNPHKVFKPRNPVLEHAREPAYRGWQEPEPLEEDCFVNDYVNFNWEIVQGFLNGLQYQLAFDEFVRSAPAYADAPPKMVALGDFPESKLADMEKKHGKETRDEPAVIKARAERFARSVGSMVEIGHRTVLAVVNRRELEQVGKWLERAGARALAVADADDLQSGRWSAASAAKIAHAGPASPSWPPPLASAVRGMDFADGASLGIGTGVSLGSFLNEKGIQRLVQRRQLLASTIHIDELIQEVEPLEDMPPPGAFGAELPPNALAKSQGMLLEEGLLRIPEEYLRLAGAGRHAKRLWGQIRQAGGGLQTVSLEQLTRFGGGKQ